MYDLAGLLVQNALEIRQAVGHLTAVAEAGRREADLGRAAINQRIDDLRTVVTSRLDKLEGNKAKGNVSWLSYLPLALRLLTFMGMVTAGVFLNLTASEWKAVLLKLK